MALKNRERLNSTLRKDNKEFVTDLCNKTSLDQSKIYDLAIDILRSELKNKNIFELIEENNSK